MDTLKRFIKVILFYSGIYRLVIRLYSDCIPILMIHGVIDESRETTWLPCWDRTSGTQLSNVLSVLEHYYQFVSMDEVSNFLDGSIEMRRPSLALTFDDGYRNNLTDADCILKNHNAPAIIYLVTGHLDSAMPMWIDRLDYVLQAIDLPLVSIHLLDKTFNIRLDKRAHLVQDFLEFRLAMKKMYKDDVEMLNDVNLETTRLEALASKSFNVSLVNDRVAGLLTTSDLYKFESTMSFGSHTVNHVRTTHVQPDRLEWELGESKNRVERVTELDCVHFCYPNGDYSQSNIELLKKSSFQTGVTTLAGSNRVNSSNLLALRRISIPDDLRNYEIVHKVVASLFKSGKVI